MELYIICAVLFANLQTSFTDLYIISKTRGFAYVIVKMCNVVFLCILERNYAAMDSSKISN